MKADWIAGCVALLHVCVVKCGKESLAPNANPCVQVIPGQTSGGRGVLRSML